MESLTAFADEGSGGLSLISTCSRLAHFLRGSAGRRYERFINKMNCNARKSYFCKMHFPSHTGLNLPRLDALSIFHPQGVLEQTCSFPGGGLAEVHPCDGKLLQSLPTPSSSLQKVLICQQQQM